MSERTPAEYTDLEVRIFARAEQGYPVEVTLAGQQEFPRGLLPPTVIPWVASNDPLADGARLLDALLADPKLRDAWATARGQAPHRRLRLRLDPQAPELHTLPWELVRDQEALLAADAATPFSRYLPIALPWGGPLEERPLRLLAVLANPSDLQANYSLAPVDREKESALLTAALQDAGVAVTFLDPPITLERLEEALRAGYHLLHITAHGVFNPRRNQAALYFQDAAGATAVVPDDALITMLARQAQKPHLVFLAACQSAVRASADAFLGLGPKLVRAGVPAVVAMQDFVTIDSAQKLASTFYRRLVATGTVDQALNEARSTLLTAGRPDAAVPVLFMRLKSGQLWSDEADARGQVLGGEKPRIFWSSLVRQIDQGRCIPVLGPRVHGRWLPTHEEVARQWADAHEYPFVDRGQLARVAQYMATNQGEDFPRYELGDTLTAAFLARLPEELRPPKKPRSLTELIRAANWGQVTAGDPNEVHRVLAGLNLPLYLTTNCDPCMTEALRAAGRQPLRELCRWHEHLDDLPTRLGGDDDYTPTPEEPLVYHIFGSDEETASLVLTEDDHLKFLVRVSAERDRIPNVIRGAVASASLLFIGYGIYDWEFRMVMHGLVANLDQRRRFKHVAVQLEFDAAGVADTAAVQTFLQEYFQDADINVFWGSTAQFIAELRENWEQR